MIRNWIVLVASCAVPSSILAQCQLRGPNPFVPIEIVASPIGQKGLGGAVIAMGASCPGDVNARVWIRIREIEQSDAAHIRKVELKQHKSKQE